MSQHKLLERQLKKFGLDPSKPPHSAEEWQIFLNRISSTYHQHDQDRYLNERSLEISSHELRQKYDLVKNMHEQLVQSTKMASLGVISSEIAHELNNPLAVVIGLTQLLSKTQLEEKQKNYVLKISNAAVRMHKTVNRLKSFAHAGQNDENLPTFLIVPIVDAMEMLQNQAEIQSIKFDVDVPKNAQIMCDRYRMESLFQNLISNSIDSFKNCPASQVEKVISMKMTEEDSNFLITYRDNAGGIAESVIDHIFDPFFSTKPVGVGSGIGLALILQILKDHHGSIEVQSDHSHWTEFKIRVPKLSDKVEAVRPIKFSPSMATRSDKNASKALAAKPKVLVVDDDEGVLMLSEAFLSPVFEVVLVENAKAALDKLKEAQFDLVVTDLRMPGMSGVELIQAIRQTYGSEMPLVLMSGHADFDKELQQALAIGANLFIPKPFDSSDSLVSQIQQLLTVKKAA